MNDAFYEVKAWRIVEGEQGLVQVESYSYTIGAKNKAEKHLAQLLASDEQYHDIVLNLVQPLRSIKQEATS